MNRIQAGGWLLLLLAGGVSGWEFAVKFEPNASREYVENFARLNGYRVLKVSRNS